MINQTYRRFCGQLVSSGLLYCAIIPLNAQTGFEAIPENTGNIRIGTKPAETWRELQSTIVRRKRGKRIMIGGKNIQLKSVILITVDIPEGQEKRPMFLNTLDNSITVLIKSPEGEFTAMPHLHLVDEPNLTYIEKRSEPAKFGEADRTTYQRVSPRWQKMNRAERLRSGEGVHINSAYAAVFVSLSLTPVVVNDKVVSYRGKMSGNGKFSGKHREITQTSANADFFVNVVEVK